VATGECIRSLAGHGNYVYSVSFNNKGLLASGSHDNTIKLWRVSTGESIRTLTGHGNTIKASALSVVQMTTRSKCGTDFDTRITVLMLRKNLNLLVNIVHLTYICRFCQEAFVLHTLVETCISNC